MSNDLPMRCARAVPKGAAWSLPAIVIGTAAPADAASAAGVDPAQLQLVKLAQRGAGPGYQEFGPVLQYAGPYADGQDHRAARIHYRFTLPKAAFDGGAAVPARRPGSHRWSATVEDAGADWVYSVALTGPEVSGAAPEASIVIRIPYVEAGRSYAGSFSASHGDGVPVLGTPVPLAGTTGESSVE